MIVEKPAEYLGVRVRLGLVLLGLVVCIGLYAYLGQRPAQPDWGLIVDARGAITWVDPASPAELAGLRAGDRLQPPVDLHALTLTSLDRRGRPQRRTFPEPPGPTSYGVAGLLVCLFALGVCGIGWTSSASRREGTLVAITALMTAFILLSYVGAQSGYAWLCRYSGVVRVVVLNLWALRLYLSIPFNLFQYRWARRGYAVAAGALIVLVLRHALARASGHPSPTLERLVPASVLMMIAAVVLAQMLRPRGLTAVQRAQRRLLLASFLVGMLLIVTFIVLPRVIGSAVGPLEPTAALGFLVIALGITVAMVRTGLLSLGVSARRAIARLALATVLAIGLVLVAAALGPGKAPPPVLAALYAAISFGATLAVLPWADRLVEAVLAPELRLSRALLVGLAPELRGKEADLAALAKIIERAVEHLFPRMRASLLIRETDRATVFTSPGRGRMVNLPLLSAALAGAAGLARGEVGGAESAEWDALDEALCGPASHLLAVQVEGEPIALLAVVAREDGALPPNGAAMEGLGLLAAETALYVNHARLQREQALEAAVSSRLAEALTGMAAAAGDATALSERVAEALVGLPEVTASAVALRDEAGQLRASARGAVPAGLAERLTGSGARGDGAQAAGVGPSLVVPLWGEGERLGSLYVAWAPGRPVRGYEEWLLGIFGRAVALNLQNAQLFAQTAERTRQEAAEAAALDTVSAALAGSLEPEQLYRIILQQAARVLPFDRAEIVLYKGGWAVSAACLGEPTVPAGTPLARIDTSTATWQLLMQGTVAYLADTAEVAGWQDTPPWVGPYRIRSSIRVPLLVEGELLGTFGISSFAPRFYSEGHLRVAAAFGERAAQALRNARLYAAEQERARAAEELARMRSDFVSSVSHELRTPLTAILGYAELLKARWERMADADRLERLERIIFSAQRQHRLVEDLLLVTRMEQGSPQPQPQQVELGSLVRRTANEVQGVYRSQQITLLGSESVVVLADLGYTLQILANLLDNAAKYSPEGSPIEVQWGTDGEQVAVRVRDQGPGIPEGGRDQLFTRFGRVPGSSMRAGHVGTGLGLYLSRTLAEAMGGSLDLEATGAEGSTFVLRLPGVPS